MYHILLTKFVDKNTGQKSLLFNVNGRIIIELKR